jgi:hypothetical protein
MSEDSDYTSDINYPLQHQHNTSAHQYRSEHPYRLRDDIRDYSRDYEGPFDSFDGDVGSFDRGPSFDQMESYEQGGSFERGVSFDNVEALERARGSFEQVDRDRYERHIEYDNDHEYDRERPYDGDRNYDHRERGFPNDRESRDYEQDQDFDREHDYYRQDDSKYHPSRDDADQYTPVRGDADQYTPVRGDADPYHPGRSDTDSEPLFYNSRPKRGQYSGPNTSSQPYSTQHIALNGYVSPSYHFYTTNVSVKCLFALKI